MNKVEKLETIIIILLVFIFIFTFFFMKSSENREEKINTSFSALKDYNRFFTIDSAISKYFTYVSSKDYDSVLKILNNGYVKKNKITKDNVALFVGNYDTNIRSMLEEAYQISSYNNIYNYYVKVALKEETLYDSVFKEYIYFVVTIDENDLLFAVEPISELVYTDKIKEESKND